MSRAVALVPILLGASLLAAPALGGGKDAPAPKASAKPVEAKPLPGPKPGFAPDPPTKSTTKHWKFHLAFDRGSMTIDKVEQVTKPNPAPSPRVMGRFAVELWIGKELLDRVRFDVPLLGDQKSLGRGFPFKPVTFDSVKTKLAVEIADAPRAAFVMLLDRAASDPDYAFKKSNLPLKLAWPPDAKGKLAELPKLVAAKPVADKDAKVAKAPEPPPKPAEPKPAPSGSASARKP